MATVTHILILSLKVKFVNRIYNEIPNVLQLAPVAVNEHFQHTIPCHRLHVLLNMTDVSSCVRRVNDCWDQMLCYTQGI